MDRSAGPCEAAPRAIPDYLTEVYSWAYLRPESVILLDRSPVVSAILWGNYRRLQRAVRAELHPGQRVLQPACVYGDLSPRLAAFLDPQGRLDVSDVAPQQVENCRRKLSAFSNTTVRVWDAANPRSGIYDVVCCFFLLHEMPEHYKRRVVDALLGVVPPGGKVVFVDYHRPHRAHPLKGVMSLVFDLLEPFAKDLWANEISSYARAAGDFTWSKQTYFGGLYQKTVALRIRRRQSPS
ncbi:MAG: rhodoquinone biosynthesis methyltransferase RquA [Kiloniellaceae bacterium]